MRQGTLLSIVLMVTILGLAPTAGATPNWEITVAEGDLLLLPDQEVDWRLAAPADQLHLGDRLWAAPSGRAAVAGPDGLQLRLDRGTQIQWVADSANQQLIMLSGAIYVRHPDMSRQGMLFTLSAGKVNVQSKTPTIMRVDLMEEEGIVSVAVQKGDVLVTTAADNAWLHSGERAEVMPTGVIEGPKSILFTDRDDFDLWNEEQELRLARHAPSPDVAEQDLGQLDGYGEWVESADYGRVWQPSVDIGWQPYFYGQWVWVSPFGWSWVSAEPWGWLPNHYGQWVWDNMYGWVWISGSDWAPAWVIWTPYQGGWAWAPHGVIGVPVSIAVHYWCWIADLDDTGWRQHRSVGSVPPSVREQPWSARHQPPHLSDGNSRARNEEVARVRPVQREQVRVSLPSADHQGDGNDRFSRTERFRGRNAELPPLVRQNPGHTRLDRTYRADEASSTRAPALYEGPGPFPRQGSGEAARPAEERRRAAPGPDMTADRLNRGSHQTPVSDAAPTRSGGPQSTRRAQPTEGAVVHDQADATVPRRFAQPNGDHQSHPMARSTVRNDAQPSDGSSGRRVQQAPAGTDGGADIRLTNSR